MEVKDNYAHVTTQRILNKFIKIYCEIYGLAKMLSISTRTTSKNIDDILKHKCDLPSWWSSSSTDILVGIIPSVVNMKGAKVSTNFIQHSEQKQNLVIRLLQNHCKSLNILYNITILKGKSVCDAVNSKIRLFVD